MHTFVFFDKVAYVKIVPVRDYQIRTLFVVGMPKKMEFVLETLTPDTFYHNLLLGLPKILRKSKKFGLRKTHLTRFLPASPELVAIWEETHDVIMPEDMKNFYYSSNGFLYQWSCAYGPKTEIIIGKIDINSIENLNQLAGYRTKSSPSVSLNGSAYLIRLGYASKVFEICILANKDKVCLVYLDRKYVPTVWICTHDMKFHFLADSFSKYFSMAITHIGFPNWQMLYIPQGIPTWCAGLMQLICPSILMNNRRSRTIETMRNHRIRRAQTQHEIAEINMLDPKVFLINSYRKQATQNCINKKDDKIRCINDSPAKRKYQRQKNTNKKLVSKTVINLKPKKLK